MKRVVELLRLSACCVLAGFFLSACSQVVDSGDSVSSRSASVELRYGTTTVSSGGTLSLGSVLIGSYKDVTLAIRNKGSKYLVLSGSPVVAFEGDGASQFELKTSSFPSILPVGGYQPFKVRFTPASVGTKSVTLKIGCNDGSSSEFKATVSCTASPIAVTGFGLDKSEIALTAGETGLLTASVAPENATYSAVSWASANPAVATVSDVGLVTAVAGGSTTITATTENGSLSAACGVTVYTPSSWMEIVPTTSLFSGRRYLQSLEFNGKLYVIAGGASGGSCSDVWYSADGAAWTEATASAGFSVRQFHSCVVYDGKIWFIGGQDDASTVYNDVWSSSDGVTWTEVLAQDPSVTIDSTVRFSPRNFSGLVTDGEKLYLVGGIIGTNYYNDVWSSADGVTWTKVRASGASGGFTSRYNGACVFLNGSIYVYGGADASDAYLADAWSSADGGATWTSLTQNAPYSPGRITLGAAAYGGKLWLTGGYNFPLCGWDGYNDLWSSPDGRTWTKVFDDGSAPFPRRLGPALTVFQNKLLLVGGFTQSGSVFYNDIWQVQ